MTTLATCTLSGDAAYLVASQGELLTNALGREIYKLRTPELRIGVYEAATRQLVIFDAAALAALAAVEAREESPAPTRPLPPTAVRKPFALLRGADQYADVIHGVPTPPRPA